MATGTNAQGVIARKNALQVVHSVRLVVRYNDTGIGSGIPTGVYLPQGAIIVGTDVHIATVFNAATTNVLTAGTNGPSTNDNIVASADVNEAATGLTQNIKPTGTALGPLSADAQIYVMYTQSGTVATTGKAYIIVKYVLDNDTYLQGV